MADSRFKAVSKAELNALLDQQIKTSGSFYDSKLSDERKKVLDYYNAKLPKPQHEGNSKYVSMDVFDGVESLKAVLLETFSAGNHIVEFAPQNEDDVPAAHAATEYTDYVVFRQNDGYKVFQDVIYNGLTARAGVAKVYWEEKTEEVVETFEQLTEDEVDMLLAAPDAIDATVEIDEVTGLYDGELTRTINKSRVRIDPIAPEEFLITPQSSSIQTAPFVAHATRKTFSDLIEEGYPRKKVERLREDNKFRDHPEVLARHEDESDGVVLDGELQEQTKYVMVYECYVRIDMKGDGIARLHKITKAETEVLDIEEVERIPFIGFVPLPVSHAFYGSNYAARIIPTQNARTVLVRGILDHTVISNNPRYQVLKGGLTNPREMLENRVGGLVNVNRPDAIAPLPQASLNPFVFQTIGLLDDDKEEVTGMSRLSTGMNKDAVSKQNSSALVDNMVTLSQQRQKIIARNFANQFVKELFLEVYRLVITHERTEKVVRIAGTYQRIDPSAWDERTDCTVDLKLGYGEQDKEAQKLMGMHQMLVQDPKAARFYSEVNAYNMYRSIFHRAGVKNVSDYMTNPEQLGQPQPDPMAMKQMELEERKVATQEAVAQSSAKKVEGNLEIDQMRVELDRMRLEIERLRDERTIDIKEFDSTSKAAIAAEELQMVKSTPVENTTAIVSPNS